MSMMEPSLSAYMESVRDMPLEVTDEDLKVESNEVRTKARQTFSRKLHYLLALLTEDGARLLVRQNTSGNGFETWRQLSQKFTLPGTTRNVGLFFQLLSYSFSDAAFQTDFDKWEDSKKKYERDTKTSIPDSVLIALLIGKTRGALLTHLRLNLAGLKTYQALREEILQRHKTNHVLKQDGHTSKGPVAMEVDALIDVLQTSGTDGLVAALHGKGYFKGKGKSKGNFHSGKGYKGKSNFKGKGNFNRFKGKGKGSHFNIKGGKGKGKGKNSKGGKGKGFGQTSGLGLNTSNQQTQPQTSNVNALENLETSGSEHIQWDSNSLEQTEAWNTFDTWNTDSWDEPWGSTWGQEGDWVNHLSSDWYDSTWEDTDWWDDGTSTTVSYPTTAVGAVTLRPPGLELPTKTAPRIHFENQSGSSTQSNTSGHTLTQQNSTREQNTAPGLRQNVAGLFVATLMTVCTLGAKGEQLGKLA
jgi:hypothetical protein